MLFLLYASLETNLSSVQMRSQEALLSSYPSLQPYFSSLDPSIYISQGFLERLYSAAQEERNRKFLKRGTSSNHLKTIKQALKDHPQDPFAMLENLLIASCPQKLEEEIDTVFKKLSSYVKNSDQEILQKIKRTWEEKLLEISKAHSQKADYVFLLKKVLYLNSTVELLSLLDVQLESGLLKSVLDYAFTEDGGGGDAFLKNLDLTLLKSILNDKKLHIAGVKNVFKILERLKTLTQNQIFWTIDKNDIFNFIYLTAYVRDFDALIKNENTFTYFMIVQKLMPIVLDSSRSKLNSLQHEDLPFHELLNSYDSLLHSLIPPSLSFESVPQGLQAVFIRMPRETKKLMIRNFEDVSFYFHNFIQTRVPHFSTPFSSEKERIEMIERIEGIALLNQITGAYSNASRPIPYDPEFYKLSLDLLKYISEIVQKCLITQYEEKHTLLRAVVELHTQNLDFSRSLTGTISLFKPHMPVEAVKALLFNLVTYTRFFKIDFSHNYYIPLEIQNHPTFLNYQNNPQAYSDYTSYRLNINHQLELNNYSTTIQKILEPLISIFKTPLTTQGQTSEEMSNLPDLISSIYSLTFPQIFSFDSEENIRQLISDDRSDLEWEGITFDMHPSLGAEERTSSTPLDTNFFTDLHKKPSTNL